MSGHKGMGIAVFMLAGLLAGPMTEGAPVRERVAAGNREFSVGNYQAAMASWDEASVDAPESPRIEFNRGTAYYRQEEYDKAEESFEKAALKSRDLHLEAKCHYNLGNCEFRKGQRQRDSDLEKSLASFQQAVRHYQEALERDPELKDAGHNIEVTRLTIKQILDEIKKQREKQKKEQEQQQKLQQKLKELIERQKKALDTNKGLQGEEQKRGRMPDVRKGTEELSQEQRKLRDETEDLAKQLNQPKVPPNVAEARKHLGRAVSEQEDASERLGEQKLNAAEPSQERALDALKEAERALGGSKQDKQQPTQQQQQQQQTPKPQPQPQQGEQPRDILDEEKENRERRQAPMQGGYRPVDKDW